MRKLTLTLCAAALAATAAGSSLACEGKHGGEQRGGRMFENMDVNGDGTITKEESQAHALEKFTKMDADADGKVTKEEAEAFHKARKEEWMKKRAEKAADVKEDKKEEN